MKLINKSAAKLAVIALAIGAISACSNPREKVMTYQCEAGKTVTVSYLPNINNNGNMPLILLHQDGQKIQMHSEGVSSVSTYATVHNDKHNWSDWDWRNEARITSGSSYVNDANNLRIRSQVGGIGEEKGVPAADVGFYVEKLNTARPDIRTMKNTDVKGTAIQGGIWEIQARACK